MSSVLTGIASESLFQPHPNFSDAINHNIVQSEIEGGVLLRDLRLGAVLAIETADWMCTLDYRGDSHALVSGHPEFCPESVMVRINGCTWGGSMLKEAFIGREMHLEFVHPVHKRILTSRIRDIRVVNESPVSR